MSISIFQVGPVRRISAGLEVTDVRGTDDDIGEPALCFYQIERPDGESVILDRKQVQTLAVALLEWLDEYVPPSLYEGREPVDRGGLEKPTR